MKDFILMDMGKSVVMLETLCRSFFYIRGVLPVNVEALLPPVYRFLSIGNAVLGENAIKAEAKFKQA